MKKLFLLFFFITGFLYAEEIEIGKRYNETEIAKIDNLETFVEIKINKRIIIIYRKNEGPKPSNSNENKIILLKDDNGIFLDAWGINLPNNRCNETTFIDNKVCVIAVTLQEVPIMRFLYIDSVSKKIIFLPRNNKYVSSVVFSDHYIFYSTEYDNSSIWSVDVINGILNPYPGYYLISDIYKSTENEKEILFFIYKNETYIIDGYKIIQTKNTYKADEKKHVKDFIVAEQ